VKTGLRAARRVQPAEDPNSADAWIELYQRKSAIRCVTPEYPDDADAETVRKATRTAQLRATDRDATGRLRWRGP
jgi:hypothetical protein